MDSFVGPGSGAAEAFFDGAADSFAVLDRDGRFVSANRACEQLLALDAAALSETRLADIIEAREQDVLAALPGRLIVGRRPYVFEAACRTGDGLLRRIEWSLMRADEVTYAVARDVTDRERRQEERTLLDSLTGLLNRAAFMDRLEAALTRLERHPGRVSVLFLDLDRFKVINDAKGHEVGDRLLRAASDRLRAALRGVDAVARFGGDEFVILVEGNQKTVEIMEIGTRVIEILSEPFALDEEWRVGASVGISMTLASVPPAQLLNEADVAMYRAKANGGGRCEIFDDEMRREVAERIGVERELRTGIREGQLSVYYQPIVALPDMSIAHCEALVRWHHPERGTLLPAAFLPLAEDSDLINEIGERVLLDACDDAMRWRRAGRNVGITVNVSPRQLTDTSFQSDVEQALRLHGLPPEALCLEITETAMMREPDRVRDSLEALRASGVQIAMDDFGTGYSSLSYLRELPLDVIKIDRSFVSGIGESRKDRAIVQALLSLARETNISVIAEGVETERLHVELLELGCELAQGFLYARPSPSERLSLSGYSSRVRPGFADPLVVREFMRQIGIPARISA